MVADDSGVELHEDVALMDRLAFDHRFAGGALQHRDDAALDRGGDAAACSGSGWVVPTNSVHSSRKSCRAPSI